MPWSKVDGLDEGTAMAGDSLYEITAYYTGPHGWRADETYYVMLNPAGRYSVEQMSSVEQWPADDPHHDGEPLHEDITYEGLGLYDFDPTEEGLAKAIAECKRYAAMDESHSYTPTDQED